MTRNSQPSFIMFDAAGRAVAVFPGGLVIPASQVIGPPATPAGSVVQWRDPTDQQMVGFLEVDYQDPDTFMRLEARNKSGSRRADIASRIVGSSGDMYVQARADGDTGNARRTIVTNEGGSDFISYGSSVDGFFSLTDIRIIALGSIAVPGLASGATFLSAVIDTTLDATDNGHGKAFSFFRDMSGFVGAFSGNQHGIACNQTVVGGTVRVQYQVRNLSTVAAVAATIGPVIMVGYA